MQANEIIVPESINFLDIRSGIQNVGGSKELYLDTLYEFHKDGLERTGEIRKSLEGKDYDLYSTHVHGIKSALRIIGAIDLSDDAYKLELAGDNKDADYIEMHNSNFLHNLTQLLDGVDEMLVMYEESIPTPDINMDEYNAALTKLKEALEDYDTQSIHRIVSQLQNMTRGHPSNADIRKISDHITESDFDEAIEELEQLIEG
jgi:HPt (histidine-containing phosphotransfer) domain-containing protein